MSLKNLSFILLIIFFCAEAKSQPVPAVDENIPYLMTFGGDAETSWGDDDFCQIFFCLVPVSFSRPFYIRVFDPDTGGALDEVKGGFNTIVNYSIYGGIGCWSDTAAQSIDLTGNCKSGFLLFSRSFGNESKFDRKWFTMGPFNPGEGEYSEKLGGRIFKIIAQGISGDDGNIYRYFMSSNPEDNVAVEAGNLFTYKYHFRLPDDQNQVCQVYPFADEKTVSIEISNFDWDNDGSIRIFSVAKNGISCDVSGEDRWVVRNFPVTEDERNTTFEIQFIKNRKEQIQNNNVVVSIRNQYGTTLAFYTIPIGGIPVYSPRIRMK
ncbi:MAG TPA: hypothetical protein VHO46_00205 [Bacteroidales bacterium]|nr:hypothetical protein [Bacteroidales bacterium]